MYLGNELIARYAATEGIRRQPRGVAAYVKVLRRVAAFADDQPVSPAIVADYLASRGHVTVTTRSFEWTVLSSFSRWAMRRELLSTPLTSLVDRPRGRRRAAIAAPAAEVTKLAAWVNQPPSDADDRFADRNRRFCGLCLYAGLRFDEARLLLWSDIDEIARELVVRNGKGGHGRRVPVAPPLGRLFAVVPRALRTGAVIGHEDGRPLSIGGGGHIFDRYLPRVVGVDLSPHMLRRAFATRLDELGHSLRIIQELLGHTSLATTERYLGVDRARKHAATDDLDGAW